MSNMESAKQREALDAIFKSTGGRPKEDDDRLDPGSAPNSWRRRKNWASQKDPCHWEGVVTELGHDPEEPDRPSGPVTELHLEYVGLQGRPKSLEKLRELRFLDFQGNGLTGSINVGVFTKLKALVHVNLSSNSLTGAIPPIFGQMPGLEYLSLAKNALDDRVPESLAGLRQLHTLDLSSNILTGAVPREICAIKTLTSLNVRRNQLTELPELGTPTCQLKVLMADRNLFRGKLPPRLPKTLHTIQLGMNKFTGSIPSRFVEQTGIL